MTASGTPEERVRAPGLVDEHNGEPRDRRAAYADAAPDGVLALDVHGYIRYANAVARGMLGLTLGPVVGEQFGVPVGDSPIELSLRAEDGSARPVEMRTTRVTLDGDERWVVTLRDVTERVEERRQIAVELENLDTALAVTSHELRNPLAALAESVGLMLEDWEELDDDARRYHLRRLERRIMRMAYTVDSILDAARIAAGTFAPEAHRVNLLELVLERLPELGGGASGIAISVPPGLEVNAHPDHVWMAVSNFLVNSIKYGEPPRGIHAARRGEFVTIEVSDEGEGVPEDAVGTIFNRYVRAGSQDTVGGTGLGLWISRSIAEAYGGSVTYRRGDPRGAVFCCELPAPPAVAVPRRRGTFRPGAGAPAGSSDVS